MDVKKEYRCVVCGSTRDRKDENEIPTCCGKPMTDTRDLPPCESSKTAEDSRSQEADEPCDEGMTNDPGDNSDGGE